MAFTSKDVMALRQKTGVGMLDCKKALEATDGDMEKAVDFLREKGLSSAAKKESRIAAEGVIATATNGNKSVLLEVNCETDFVAKSDAFKNFVSIVANYILDNDTVKVEDIPTILAKDFGEVTIKVGEKISVRRYTVYTTTDDTIDTYIHFDQTIGVMVEMSAGTPKTVAHDVALQIATMDAKYIDRNEVPADVVEHEKEIIKAQIENEDSSKPAAIIEKMVLGKINKFYKEVCLVDQDFIKDNSLTIGKYIAANGGGKIVRFQAYKMGEGIEKRNDNLADEIAKMTGNK